MDHKTYWHFDRRGNFLRTVSFYGGELPPLLADDGFPRNVAVTEPPKHDPETEFVSRGRNGWVVDKLPLGYIKAKRSEAITDELHRRLKNGVSVNGIKFGATPDDQAAWIAALTTLSLAERISGTDITALPASQFIGPVLALGGKPLDPQPTVGQLRVIVAGIGTAIASLRVESIAMLTAIDSAVSNDDVKAISWRAG